MNREKIIDSYTVTGVPESLIKNMCNELNVSYDTFIESMNGQTCGLVGNEALYYPWDIKRFINNLPSVDYLTQRGNIEKALEYLDRAIDIFPDKDDEIREYNYNLEEIISKLEDIIK